MVLHVLGDMIGDNHWTTIDGREKGKEGGADGGLQVKRGQHGDEI